LAESQVASIHPWTPPTGPLGRLTAAAAQRVQALLSNERALERAAESQDPAASFVSALSRADVGVIAELKRRSPSRGVINDDLDVSARTREYTAGGAAALSVLTEPAHFGGSLEDLASAHEATSLPVLRKDFIVDRLQLLEARAAGASAVLLIARALAPAILEQLESAARALGLETLIEVRDERELERALRISACVIGINNRNLETLSVEDGVSERLLPLVPANRIAVYESGVANRQGMERAAMLGADAVLVGSALSLAADARGAVSGLVGVPRCRRDR
jgi:indole-3-glycerol phosphate synthase